MPNYSIKDKKNLLTHNAWTGGEYQHNLTNIYMGEGQETLISNECSLIGDTSLKITRTGNNIYWTEVRIYDEYVSSKGEVTLFSQYTVRVYAMIVFNDGTQTSNYIDVPPNIRPQWISISLPDYDYSKTIMFYSLRIVLTHINDYCFASNFSITAQ